MMFTRQSLVEIVHCLMLSVSGNLEVCNTTSLVTSWTVLNLYMLCQRLTITFSRDFVHVMPPKPGAWIQNGVSKLVVQ